MTADKSSLQEESRVAVGGVELPDLPYKMYARSDAEMLMRAYGEACALAERERCALIAEHLNGWGSRPCPELADHIAAAIRGE
jgi:2C-methyl-D-erythritol 2,4-cyclodiphosphate synthase